jgi:hypothetical protein
MKAPGKPVIGEPIPDRYRDEYKLRQHLVERRVERTQTEWLKSLQELKG